MLTIACVLRSGGIFDGRWVQRLKRNAAAFAPTHKFVCLSDVPIWGVETIPLKHDWPRWWPILEVFRPGLFNGRVVYMDLANLIVGRLEPVLWQTDFMIAPDPFVPGPSRFASGLMSFWGDDNEIYERFARKPDEYMARLHGDQEFISEIRPKAQTYEPGIAVSYKSQCKGKD